ncbi:hypothetical protein LR48_Vigan11g096600 [Vigna angularis]|uniref:Uncharacterized protein n=1 Tax=Phaseolus angularis TaxID=3914 RepID=A0A0L9VSK5_PHAAN|nr:hypothetical protein LR48_Vigan11g096600 [Vigna angularis]
MINPKTTTLKDLMNMFNGVVLNDDIEVQFDSYLSNHDLRKPLIRAAFHMDDGARPVEERHENEGRNFVIFESVEKVEDRSGLEADGDDEVQGNEEAAKPVGYEDPAGEVDEEPTGGKYEESVGGKFEEPVCEADEEHASEADEEPTSEADEEPLGVPHDHPTTIIDIVDDDEGDFNVVLLFIPPLCNYVGDPRTTVDLDKLCNSVTAKGIERRFVSEICGQPLTTTECESLGPRQYVDNLVVFFASLIFMYFEKRLSGVVKRIVFSPVFGLKDLEELQGFRKKYACDWILDNDNVRRFETLKHFGLI